MSLEVTQQVVTEGKGQEAHRMAVEMYSQAPDWVTFFREVMGVDGVLRRLFREPVDMAAFERTAEYSEIKAMLGRLRERTKAQDESKEPTRVITVRMPQSLHDALKAEAHDRHTSMNRLCITKLLQVIEEAMNPDGDGRHQP